LKIQVPIIAKTPGSSLELHLRTRRREDPAIEIYANGIAVRRARGKDGARSPEGDRCVGPEELRTIVRGLLAKHGLVGWTFGRDCLKQV